jgi:hypothetical protein
VNRPSETSRHLAHSKNTSDQAMEDTAMSRSEHHHTYQPSHASVPLSDAQKSLAISEDTFRPSRDVQAAFAQSQLTTINDDLGFASLPQAQQHANVPSVSDFYVAAYPAIVKPWDDATHLSLERHGSGDWNMMASLSQVSPRTSSILDAVPSAEVNIDCSLRNLKMLLGFNFILGRVRLSMRETLHPPLQLSQSGSWRNRSTSMQWLMPVRLAVHLA